MKPVLVEHRAGPATQPKELPEEWALRVLGAADLEDDGVVLRLLDEFGAVDPHGQPIIRSYFNPLGVPQDRRALLGGYGTYSHGGALEDARWWLKTARALAGMWAEASAGRYAAPVWYEEGLVGQGSCWGEFVTAFNVGLSPFRAHLELHVEGAERALGAPRVDLYEAACAQVYNFIVQHRVGRRCENETCETRFVHQLGGAEHGQYRSRGVLRFCSPVCAQAQSQREYRRRKAAQKKGGKS